MADQKTHTIQLDGNKLVAALHKAGMDPAKLDLHSALGAKVDVEELQSRLREAAKSGASASAGGWHVTVTVSVDNK
jgi:hypothetical protein